MAFFVVARTSDGHLQLVSPDTFSSRQAAMSALSEATREPDFAHWDAELLVVDLDSAVPVLLVRPTQPETPLPLATEALDETEAIEAVELAEEVVVAAEASALIEELETEDVVELVGDGVVGEELEPIVELEPIEEPEPIVELEVAEEPEAVEEPEAAASVEAVEEPVASDEPEPVEEAEPARDALIDEVQLEPYEIEDVAIGETIAEEILAELEGAGIQGEAVEPLVDTTEPSDEAAIVEPQPAAEEAPAEAEEPASFSVSALMVESAIADAVLESEAPADAPVVDEVFGDLVMPAVTEHPEPAVSIDERLGISEPSGAVDAPDWMIETQTAMDTEAQTQDHIELEADAEAATSADVATLPSELGSWQPDIPEPPAGVSESTAGYSPGGESANGTTEALGGVVIEWPWDTQAGEDAAGVEEERVANVELVAPPVAPIEDAVEEDRALESVLVEPDAIASEPSPEVPVEFSEAPGGRVADVPTTTLEAEIVQSEPASAGVVAEPEAEGATGVEQAVGTSRDEIADFIFDLENVTDIPEGAAKESASTDSDDAGPTCGECVYDETCPNREQRSPQQCGSFQWKIA